jgi:hypothetical protein
VTKSEETRENLEGTVGADLEYKLHRKFRLRAGYRYGFSLDGDDPYKENRVVFEQNFTQTLPLEIVATDRSREELRSVNGDFSFRYRNRPTLEREFKLGRFKPAPYVSGETYYDTRYDTWNRNRIYLGFELPLRRGFPLTKLIDPERQVVLDLYWMRQVDSRSNVPRINGIGVVAKFYF